MLMKYNLFTICSILVNLKKVPVGSRAISVVGDDGDLHGLHQVHTLRLARRQRVPVGVVALLARGVEGGTEETARTCVALLEGAGGGIHAETWRSRFGSARVSSGVESVEGRAGVADRDCGETVCAARRGAGFDVASDWVGTEARRNRGGEDALVLVDDHFPPPQEVQTVMLVWQVVQLVSAQPTTLPVVRSGP
jgi:hypothetical protein